MGAAECTDCGGTCSDTISSCQLDVSPLTACDTCGKTASGDCILTLTRFAECPDAGWSTIDGCSGYEIRARLEFDSTEGCYKLTVECFTAPTPPFFQSLPVTMWVGCKGGSSPVGTYTRNDGCDGSISDLAVT